jgi:hypothetical protein
MKSRSSATIGTLEQDQKLSSATGRRLGEVGYGRRAKMVQEISKICGLPAPDERRPIPSLPAWVTSRVSALVENLQTDPETGKWYELLTVPTEMILTPAQQLAIEEHLRGLRSLLDQTPNVSEEAEKKTFAAITKLMLAKPGRAGSPQAAEARGEAYTMALDDVPYWAVWEAIRLWYRGECGNDERGKSYDYQWAPDSAVLRKHARGIVGQVLWRIRDLERLLSAVPFRDCTVELERGRAAWRGLRLSTKNADELVGLTFAKAIERGERLPGVAGSAAPHAEAAE